MKSIAVKIAIVSVLISTANAAVSAVIPFGVQNNVSTSTLNGWGWSMCYSESEYGGSNTLVSSIESSCNNDYTMMSLFNLNTNTYDIAAAGESSAVFKQTQGIYSTVVNDGSNLSNGVNWYLYDNPNSAYGGWGFFSQNSSIQPWHCDYSQSGNVNKSSMCMHMLDVNGAGDANSDDDYIYDVYSIFNNGVMTYINSNYEIRFFSTASSNLSQADIPAPTAVSFISLGLLMFAYRRLNSRAL